MFYVVVKIGLDQSVYTLNEDAGIAYIGLSVQEGSLDREITVQIVASDGTAKSKHFI